jgi:thiol-disulfide isomerase/thioredoxin
VSAEPRSVRWRRSLRDAGIFLGILLAARFWQGRGLADGDVPRLALHDLGGAAVELGGGRSEPYVVHFWATWCGVCAMEKSNIVALAERHDVIAIASRSGSADAVASYANAEGLSPHVRIVLDQDGALASRFGVGAFPTTFYVSPSGRIAAREVGYTTWLGMEARLLWAR